MRRIKIVLAPDGTYAPEKPWPKGTILVRGDIEAGWYLCYEEGDELPPPALEVEDEQPSA